MRTRGLIVVVLAGLLWATALPALGAGSLEAHGWWWRVAGMSGLPSPPWVPEDGLAVARDLEGPSAIAAVRYEVGDDVSMATLTLEVASEQGGQTAAIRACPARARWRGADAGDWEHRPSADCEAGEARGERDEEGETWSFDVGLLVDDGTLNIILLPASEEEVPEGAPPEPGVDAAQDDDGGPPFQVAFEPPTDESLEVSEGFGFGDGDDFETDGSDDDGFDEGAQASGPQPAPSQSFEEAPAPRDSGGSDGLQVPEAAAPEPRDADAPELAESDDAGQESEEPITLEPPDGGEQAPGDEELAAAPLTFGEDRGRQLALAVAVAAALAGAALWLSPSGAGGVVPGLRRSLIVRPEVAAGMAGLLPGAGEQRPRGLGRFAKPRQGDPPPL